MRANNLTVCIDAGCKKNCPYCISEMTWFPKPDQKLFYANMNKALRVSEIAGISSVLLTSKGEPLENLSVVDYCLRKFHLFPTEIQTNGLNLLPETINLLGDDRLNTIAISIDNLRDIYRFKDVYKHCNAIGINVRLTIILSNLWKKTDGAEFLVECYNLGIKQLTFRKLSIPYKVTETLKCTDTIRWINNNNTNKHEEFLSAFKAYEKPENLIRNLPFGASVYSMGGIAVTTFPYCIQEFNNTEDIRSLIYHQDGHMYTSWSTPASILF